MFQKMKRGEKKGELICQRVTEFGNSVSLRNSRSTWKRAYGIGNLLDNRSEIVLMGHGSGGKLKGSGGCGEKGQRRWCGRADRVNACRVFEIALREREGLVKVRRKEVGVQLHFVLREGIQPTSCSEGKDPTRGAQDEDANGIIITDMKQR